MSWDGSNYRNLLTTNVYPGDGSVGNPDINNYIESGMAFLTKAGATPLTVTLEENDKVSGSKLVLKGSGDNASSNFVPGSAQRIFVKLNVPASTPVLLDGALSLIHI